MAAGLQVETAYRQIGERPVAYLDETYNVDLAHPQRYYVMTAVVVQASQRDVVRSDLVGIVGSSFWHTSEGLRTEAGRSTARDLLDYLADPAGTETCIVSVVEPVDLSDSDGELARERCLGSLLTHVSQQDFRDGPIGLCVLERRRDRKQANRDVRTRRELIASGSLSDTTRMLQVSPGDEQLLWLPDLVCSAYRQALTRRDETYFEAIEEQTTVITPPT